MAAWSLDRTMRFGVVMAGPFAGFAALLKPSRARCKGFSPNAPIFPLHIAAPLR
jgi:hypothetical protein